MKICPAIKYFKILTIAIAVSSFSATFASDQIVDQEQTNTYLRWNLFTGRDQLHFSKKGNTVLIKTLNQDVYERLKAELEGLSLDNKYLKQVKFTDSATQGSAINAMMIEIELKNPSVEMFSFYRERDRKYVVDFWQDNSDSVSTNNAAVIKPEAEAKATVTAPATNPVVLLEEAPKPKVVAAQEVITKKVAPTPLKKAEIAQDQKLKEQITANAALSKFIIDPNNPKEKTYGELENEKEEAKKAFRDFRYGATFIWDYDPIIPAYKQLVNLDAKVPEAFFQIDNRDFKKNEKEAHLQLVINLYRQKKWGLMYKSIKLFEQKYGVTTDWETLEYVKANAILKENIEKPNPEMFKTALSMLTNISEKSKNYELKKAIYKYLMSYYVQRNEPVKVLQIAKTYYAESRDHFDFEESIIPAEAMLNSLAKLGQIDKINELSNEKTMKKVIPAQMLLGYQSYSYLRNGDLAALIDFYEKNRAGLARPIDPVILYNTAEAYFRLGKYPEALVLYQDFVKDYSYEFVASNAHLRIALASDLLDRNYFDVMELYKKAIDLSTDATVSYEARVRYVGFRSVRKKALDDRDVEMRIFLEQDKNVATPDKNITRLLQQVRLRTLIVDGKFKEALAYLSLIPVQSMPKVDARMFEGDGAEIIYGLMLDSYKSAQYAQVIKVWANFKNKYIDKVAMDPFLNYVVGQSYVKLGLFKGFDEVYGAFEKLKETPNRTFPIWVSRSEELKSSDLLKELAIIKDIRLKNWDLAKQEIAAFEKVAPNYNKTNYYKGMIAFNDQDYKGAITHFENFFAKQDQRIIYDPSDIADMIQAYTDSIYELKQTDKFLKVSEAILNDTNSFGMDNAYIQNVRERIAYLAIEIKASEKSTNFMIFEKQVNDFKKAHTKSAYTARLNYLLGQAMIANQKLDEGREIFNNLINDKEASEYLKELAKSELGLLNLKEKTL